MLNGLPLIKIAELTLLFKNLIVKNLLYLIIVDRYQPQYSPLVLAFLLSLLSYSQCTSIPFCPGQLLNGTQIPDIDEIDFKTFKNTMHN